MNCVKSKHNSHNKVAARVAAHKEAHPELFCLRKGCLWRTGDGKFCPRHKHPQEPEEELQ